MASKDVITPPPKQDYLTLALKDIAAGSIGGVAQVIVGHPLDTLKVRLQTQSELYSGAIDCFKKTVSQEGFAGLYKGIQSPLIGLAAMNSVMFLAYGQSKAFIQPDPSKPLSLGQYVYAGALTGIAVSVVESPVDFFKSQMQVSGATTPKYANFFDCAKSIVKSRGLAGAYQGIGATFLRDIPSNAAYFGFYELARMNLVPKGGRVEDLPGWKVMIAGGFGGMMYWSLTYPTDVIKSSIQTDNINPAERKYHGIIDCAKKIYAKEGIRGFYKGFSVCFIRSIPANAACFVVYEKARDLLGR
eukprot:TRINITY_DN7172_c0_g1_i1.p1 TRINITY_DN7172_c0_g1~~TRINITY_DN7172_c0_g1_i1.p1  ORF type:complete len:301 (+),score=46.79 TRINITY_DN7172_c0_g1_i1:874-1776(+)